MNISGEEDVLAIFVSFVLFAKVMFVMSSVIFLFISKMGMRTSISEKMLDVSHRMRKRTETLFTLCTASLLVLIFNPWSNNLKYMTPKLKMLFYMFGMTMNTVIAIKL